MNLSGKSAFFLLLATILTGSFSLCAQSDSAATFSFVRFQYSFLLPGGDFETTFGNSSSLGGALGHKTANNWQFEAEGNFMFGSDLKRKDLLSDIINEAGDVTDSDGELIKLVYDLRGFNFYLSAGKIFNVSEANPNSGILTQFGIGFLQHRIFIDYRDGQVFQLNDEMLKGYDRKHNGFSTKQFIGYQHYGKKNFINFFAGIELEQAFTKNRREYNYDTRSFDTDQKFDFLYGFRFGWSIPIRKRATGEFYYY